eukprot:comp22498_c0_seq1/m.56046 comp22498_c0_seq1/g.56046  ORF comp22498_c0_seq1/g.56046 comp22498_c0_seq1/m.56046 type:complete len:318 (-) comp22498_c0_seq1:4669-5622(-)
MPLRDQCDARLSACRTQFNNHHARKRAARLLCVPFLCRRRGRQSTRYLAQRRRRFHHPGSAIQQLQGDRRRARCRSCLWRNHNLCLWNRLPKHHISRVPLCNFVVERHIHQLRKDQLPVNAGPHHGPNALQNRSHILLWQQLHHRGWHHLQVLPEPDNHGPRAQRSPNGHGARCHGLRREFPRRPDPLPLPVWRHRLTNCICGASLAHIQCLPCGAQGRPHSRDTLLQRRLLLFPANALLFLCCCVQRPARSGAFLWQHKCAHRRLWIRCKRPLDMPLCPRRHLGRHLSRIRADSMLFPIAFVFAQRNSRRPDGLFV